MNRRRTAFAERKIDLSPIFLQTFRCPSPAVPDLWRSGQRERSRQEMQRQRTCEQPDGHVQVLRALWIAVDNVVRRRSQSDPTASLWGFSFRVSFIVSRGTGLPGARGKRTRQIFFLGFWSFPTRPVRLSLLSSQARRFPPYFRNCENVRGTPQEDEPTQHQTRCRSTHSNGAPLKIPMAAQHHLRIDLDAIRGRHHTPSTLFGRWTRMASRTRRAVATACSASARVMGSQSPG